MDNETTDTLVKIVIYIIIFICVIIAGLSQSSVF